MAANQVPDAEVCRLLRIAASDSSRIVSVVDDIVDHLTDLGFVYRMRVLPAMMGVHPQNRDGLGINEADCHKLGADICALGWSSNACRDAIAIEDSPSGHIETFTAKICNGTNRLAHVQPGTIKFGSLSCGHTSQFLRAVTCLCFFVYCLMVFKQLLNCTYAGFCFVLYIVYVFLYIA